MWCIQKSYLIYLLSATLYILIRSQWSKVIIQKVIEAQEIFYLLWSSKIYKLVLNSRNLDTLVAGSSPYLLAPSLNFILLLSSELKRDFPSRIQSSGFPTEAGRYGIDMQLPIESLASLILFVSEWLAK